MTTLLTNNGWINANDESFPWTNQTDVVNPEGSEDNIVVNLDVEANSLGGDDIITDIDSIFGIDNFGTINTGDGNDIIIGTGSIAGIQNFGTINTGNGNDSITSTGGFIGISNESTITTGKGDDDSVLS